MNKISPLRYPGGKAAIAALLEDVLDLNDLRGCAYYEPYVGGAGAALKLLNQNCVSEININDADPRVYFFWKSALNETSRFVDDIFSIPINIDTWKKQKEICSTPSKYNTYEVGFSAFFMNRCNRSGILRGAGPIGGMDQSGKWRMDVRFNRAVLSKRITEIAQKKEVIHISNMDAIDFLKMKLPKGTGRKRAFVYLDPPYVNKADRLYMNIYEQKDHCKIASYLLRNITLNWLMSYDDTPLVRNLYNNIKILHIPIRYSLQSKRLAKELIIAPKHVILPSMLFDMETNSLTHEGIR